MAVLQFTVWALVITFTKCVPCEYLTDKKTSYIKMQYQNSNILILRQVYGKVVMNKTVGHTLSLR